MAGALSPIERWDYGRHQQAEDGGEEGVGEDVVHRSLKWL